MTRLRPEPLLSGREVTAEAVRGSGISPIFHEAALCGSRLGGPRTSYVIEGEKCAPGTKARCVM